MGALIIDGFCDGILLFNQSKQKGGKKISDKVTDATAFGILQAGRVRTSKRNTSPVRVAAVRSMTLKAPSPASSRQHRT